MPNWSEILNDIRDAGGSHDIFRRRFIKDLSGLTGRNTIIYYSGWLQGANKPSARFSIDDSDMNGFMSVIYKLDRSSGLDLVLHTPGGDMAATEALISYLHSMFDSNIRAIIPQMAMSGGTMIACSAREIVMGHNSSIGPFDPQVGSVPAQAITEEFARAQQEMTANPASAFTWQPILQKYELGFISQCEKVIKLADEVVSRNLVKCMFEGDVDAEDKARNIVAKLGSHAETKMHGRHISKDRAKEIGLRVIDLEADPDLQDAVLSVHHACMLTFENTPAVKIVENQNGSAVIQSLNPAFQRVQS